jgi:hypothetical protein
VFAERALLRDAVNAERARRRLQAITLEDVREVETTAVGHSDYAQKLAWRCAELAVGQAQPQASTGEGSCSAVDLLVLSQQACCAVEKI